MPILSKLGLFFREHREAAGLTREQVAGSIESLTSSALDAFEAGKGTLGVDDLFALTNILNIDPEEFLSHLQPAAIAALETDMVHRLRDDGVEAVVAHPLPLRAAEPSKLK